MMICERGYTIFIFSSLYKYSRKLKNSYNYEIELINKKLYIIDDIQKIITSK